MRRQRGSLNNVIFCGWGSCSFCTCLGNGIATGNENDRKNGESTADFALFFYFVSLCCIEDSSPTPVFLQGFPLCKTPWLAVGWELVLRSSGMSWWMGMVEWGAGMSDIQGELSTGPQLKQLWGLARDGGRVWVRTAWSCTVSQVAPCPWCHQSPWDHTGHWAECDKSAWLMEGLSLPPGKLRGCSGLCSGPWVLQKDSGHTFHGCGSSHGPSPTAPPPFSAHCPQHLPLHTLPAPCYFSSLP